MLYTAAAGNLSDATMADIEAAPVFLMCFCKKYEESTTCRRGYCNSNNLTLQIVAYLPVNFTQLVDNIRYSVFANGTGL